MHAFLIIGNKTEDLENQIEKILEEASAVRFDLTLQRIADVKELKSLVKVSFGQKTAILINDFENATEETQNAFLKNLEEPQKNIIYILLANSLNGILPTIISRCEVREIKNQSIDISEKDHIEIVDFINSSVGSKLAFISKIKDREEAVSFINNLIIVSHSLLIDGKVSPKFIENAQKTLTALKLNGNVNLQLTNLVVNIQ